VKSQSGVASSTELEDERRRGMPRLTWNAIGERYFETGVDQGVLYIDQAGFAWPGLISVSENPTGGEPRPYYIDGLKYLNLSSNEEFEATVEAFYSPPEFGPCDGTVSIHNGLFVTQQPRKQFGMSYRTKIGNDVDGADHGYKIHLVYNALAAPAERSHSTLSDSPEATPYSWDLTTLAPRLTGFRPTAHFVINSLTTPDALMRSIEDVLYGNDDDIPRLPEISEIIEMFAGFFLMRIVEIEPGVWEIWSAEPDEALAYSQPNAPTATTVPILWFDTSGDVAIPTLVTGA
jgi:hypothetical protein